MNSRRREALTALHPPTQRTRPSFSRPKLWALGLSAAMYRKPLPCPITKAAAPSEYTETARRCVAPSHMVPYPPSTSTTPNSATLAGQNTCSRKRHVFFQKPFASRLSYFCWTYFLSGQLRTDLHKSGLQGDQTNHCKYQVKSIIFAKNDLHGVSPGSRTSKESQCDNL